MVITEKEPYIHSLANGRLWEFGERNLIAKSSSSRRWRMMHDEGIEEEECEQDQEELAYFDLLFPELNSFNSVHYKAVLLL